MLSLWHLTKQARCKDEVIGIVSTWLATRGKELFGRTVELRFDAFQWTAKHDEAVKREERWRKKHLDLVIKHETLTNELDELKEEHSELTDTEEKLRDTHNALVAKSNARRDEYNTLLATHNALATTYNELVANHAAATSASQNTFAGMNNRIQQLEWQLHNVQRERATAHVQQEELTGLKRKREELSTCLKTAQERRDMLNDLLVERTANVRAWRFFLANRH